jgi:hypothetical protein
LVIHLLGLLVVINGYWYLFYWWLFLLMAIGGYFINGYCWLLMDIGTYFINGYCTRRKVDFFDWSL